MAESAQNSGQQTSFLGRGWAFPPSFDRVSGTTDMVSDALDIKQSLEILLSTRIGERLLEPRYGCDLTRFIFEPLDTTLRTYIADVIRDAILYFEPRIKLEDLQLQVDANEGALNILLEYFIPSTNSRNNLVYPFYVPKDSQILSGSELSGSAA